MKFAIACYLDIYIGKLILKIISLIPPYPQKVSRNLNIKNLLIIKFWGFGSILEATPLCRALKAHYPNVSIDILTFSKNRQIVESLGLFQNVHVIEMEKGIITLFWETFRFILKYRRKYSLLIDLEFFANFSAMITKMLSSSYSLGFDNFLACRNLCYSRTIIFDHSTHIRVIFLKFLNALHINKNTDISLSAPIVPDEKKLSVTDKYPLLKAHGTKIAMNINSGELSVNRRWPLENFQKLVRFIQQDYKNLQIYIVGGKDDIPVVNSFYESLPDKRGVINTAGKLDILEFSYALTFMCCMITNDSGPLHIAEAVGTPVVSFFGPETSNLYGPLSESSLVFYKNLFCSPCINTYNHKRSRCKDNMCLKLINAEEVYEKMKSKYLTGLNVTI